MLEAYSLNTTVTAESPIPFNSVSLVKGGTAVLASPTSIELNRKGVYMVSFNGTAAASDTVQLYKDGVAQPQAQATGTSLAFTTLVQCDRDNSCCCCASPVTLQVVSESAATLSDANIVVTKIC